MSKSSPNQLPNQLIDRYLQAVRFWLSKTGRADDLIAELGEDLRSQADDKESQLGHSLNEAEIAEILKRCGPPLGVAGRLQPQGYLIGPSLFPIYTFILKMTLLWMMVPIFLFIIGPVNFAQTHGDWTATLFRTFGAWWTGSFIAAGIITIVFAALERTHAHMGMACKWDPLTLPPLQKQQRKTSMLQSVCELGFGFFGLIWLLLFPTYPFLIFGPAAAFLKLGPLFHTFYIPVVLLAIFGILRSAAILVRPQWTAFPRWSQLLQSVLTLILLNLIINAAGRSGGIDWHPFVAPADTVVNSAQYIKAAAVVNASILLSAAGTWLGLSIAIVIQTWQFLRYLRQKVSATRQTVMI